MSTDTIASQKQHSRKLLRALRRDLPEAEVTWWSLAMARQLAKLSVYREATQLFGFVGSKDNEPQTLPMLNKALQQGKSVWLPVVTGPGQMRWAPYQAGAPLHRSRWGILEPDLKATTAPPQATTTSCCLVPGLAFTPDGYRLGYGGGFYDRFLTDFPGVTIGLCFEALLQSELPVEAHDQRVDWVITESRAIAVHPA